jgi:hypothetical protein
VGCTLDSSEAIKIIKQSKVLLGISKSEDIEKEPRSRDDPAGKNEGRDLPARETDSPKRIGRRGGPLSLM